MRAILVAFVLLLASAGLAEAADGHGKRPDTPTADQARADASSKEDRAGRDAKDADEDDDEDEDDRDREREDRQRRPAAIGAFRLASAAQSVEGDFVRFSYNDSGIQNFTLAGVDLFDVHVEGAARDASAATARGSQLRLRASTFDVHVHDNPEGVTRIQTRGLVQLAFADGVNLTEADGDRVHFRVGAIAGTVKGDDLRVQGNVLLGREDVLVFAHEAKGNFDKHRASVAQAIGKGRVGAEASINQAGDAIQEEVVSYGNVTLRTLRAEKGNLTIEIDGHGFDGRVLGAQKRDELQILFDHMPVREADNITDVLDPDDDGLHAEYYLVFDPNEEAFQLLVSVPHYSVHTLSVMTLVAVAPPGVLLGVALGVILLVPSAFVLFRRKTE